MSKFFINRPIVAMVIAIVTVIVGAVTVISLPVAQFPNIAPPEIQVLATYTGADAQTLEQSVATPIEQQMSGVDNANYFYSVNATGNSQTTLVVNFDVKTDPNTDLILVQSRETQAASQLPADVTNLGITVRKSVTAPLMLVAVYSPHGSSTPSSLPTMPTSIWLIRSRAPQGSVRSRYSELASTQCAFGSGQTNLPSWESRSRRL